MLKQILLVAVLVASIQSIDYIGTWTQIPGGLAYTSVDYDGQVWGCNAGQGIYTRKGVEGVWQNIPGGLKQINVRNGQVWGVNAGQGVYHREGVAGTWVNIPGAAINHIAVDDDGTVFGVNTLQNIFTRPGVEGDWQQIPGGLSQIDVNQGIVVGCNSAGTAYWYDSILDGSSPEWKEISSDSIPFKHMSINRDGTLVGVSTSGTVHYKQNYADNGSWESIDGIFVNAHHKGDYLWGTAAGQKIFVMDQDIPKEHRVNPEDYNNWEQIPGGLNYASIDANGEAWGVNSGSSIYTKEHIHDSEWVNIPGGLRSVDVANGVVWGTNKSQQIFTKDNSHEGNWQQIAGGLYQVSVDEDGTVWGANWGQGIYYREPAAAAWVNAPGGLRQLDVANEHIIGINAGKAVYSRQGKSGTWKLEKGSFKHVSVNFDGRMFAIDATSNNIYTHPGAQLGWMGWQKIPGNLAQISVKGQHMIGTTADQQIWYQKIDFGCGIIFSECGFSGRYELVCDKNPLFDQDIRSVIVPDYKKVTIFDQRQFEGQTAIFTESIDCIAEEIDYSLLQKQGVTFLAAKTPAHKFYKKHMKSQRKSNKKRN